jgi:hypothetical protein
MKSESMDAPAPCACTIVHAARLGPLMSSSGKPAGALFTELAVRRTPL